MFNSLKYAKQLEEAGVSRAQAEVHMQIMTEIMETSLATKQDILDVRRDIRELEYKLIIKVGMLVSVSMGVLVTVVKLFE
jgi:hypothetical protein